MEFYVGRLTHIDSPKFADETSYCQIGRGGKYEGMGDTGVVVSEDDLDVLSSSAEFEMLLRYD